MKIVLATMHANPVYTPLALLYLKAYLVERKGYAFADVEILEFTQESRQDDIVRGIQAEEPDVVGLSCYIWNVTTLMAVARQLKELRPRTRIVLGGPEVGPISTSVLHAHPSIDAIVKSEGEIPFSEIIEAWRDGGGLESVRGISFRRGQDIIDTESAPILKDLNHIPSPHLARYGDHKGRAICLETQRGCVFRCNFCFYNKDLSIRNRRFDLERVKEEILFWLQHEVREIYLMDPIFNLNAERAKDICRFVIQHNHGKIGFHAELWAEFIDEELARLLHDANFYYLEVGLQTTDGTALATVERRFRLKPFVEGIEHLKTFKLKFQVHLIFGLPGETLASFKTSLDFASSLEPYELSIAPLMILPGTELWKKAQALSLDFDPDPPYLIRSHASMSARDVDYGGKMMDAFNHVGNSRAIRVLGKDANLSLAAVIDEWIAWQDTRHARPRGDWAAGAGLPAPASAGDEVGEFLRYVCAKKGIPSKFYLGFSALEFRT